MRRPLKVLDRLFGIGKRAATHQRIDNRKLRLLVEQAAYTGPIEVEIFNRALWDSDPEDVLKQVIERFERFV